RASPARRPALVADPTLDAPHRARSLRRPARSPASGAATGSPRPSRPPPAGGPRRPAPSAASVHADRTLAGVYHRPAGPAGGQDQAGVEPIEDRYDGPVPEPPRRKFR